MHYIKPDTALSFGYLQLIHSVPEGVNSLVFPLHIGVDGLHLVKMGLVQFLEV